ncbi:hypothetical protein ACFYXH_27095 [Streptomyces sp. NPDC002730]|uniref:hypothetical protein n=1 Tax=Streptomyces sp. NPDC002730 TaxID=3364662 RepID=UPI0036987AEC
MDGTRKSVRAPKVEGELSGRAVTALRITQARSDEGGVYVPGVGDRPGTAIPVYDLTATADEDSC